MGVNTEIGLQKTGQGMDWIQLAAQPRGKCRFVETRRSTFGFHNMRGISRSPEHVLCSQEGCCLNGLLHYEYCGTSASVVV